MNLVRFGRGAPTLGVLAMLLVFVVHAEPTGVVSPTTRIEQEREQALRLKQLEQAKESVQALQQLPSLPEQLGEESGNCFEIQSIQFDGNELFLDDELLAQLDFEPACLGLSDINEYLRVITNFYVEAGFVTSRAFLVPQDLSSGTLLIVILEGKVENVLLNGVDSDDLHLAFFGVVGDVLNLRDIEQGLDQVNRLSRYNAQIKLLPGKVKGYSIVDIQTSEGFFAKAGLGFNNGGQKSTGEEQLSLNLTGENLLGLLDKWTLSATHSAEFLHSKKSDSLYFSFDAPLGYWNLAYRTSYSTYKTTFSNNGYIFDSTGKTNSHDADLKWLFYRDDQSKSSLALGVHHRREKNYILDSLLESGSRNLSSASLSLEYSSRLAGGFVTLSPKLSVGTDWFGGESTSSNNGSLPTAQFIKSSLTASYTYPFTNELSLNSTAFAQWSNDTLYGNERLSIGGQYSVRGFKGVSLSGDEGYYWRNDLTYRVVKWPYIGGVSTELALDTGSIAKDHSDELERGSMLGSSLAIRLQNTYYSSSFNVGFPIESPDYLNADDYVIYYQLNFTL